jgi:SH3-like domain-containing protein
MKLRVFRFLLIAAMLVGAVPTSMAQQDLPRWVSLRSNEVNLRAGPGTRYPIDLVFVRKSLPVEIIAEFNNWRQIRDMDGDTGWIHQNLLSRNRFAVIVGDLTMMVRDPEVGGVPVAVLEPGIIAQLLRCRGDWCQLNAGGHTGWLLRTQIWGVYREEEVD